MIFTTALPEGRQPEKDHNRAKNGENQLSSHFPVIWQQLSDALKSQTQTKRLWPTL